MARLDRLGFPTPKSGRRERAAAGNGAPMTSAEDKEEAEATPAYGGWRRVELWFRQGGWANALFGEVHTVIVSPFVVKGGRMYVVW